MDPQTDPPKSPSSRHKCSACLKQFNRKEHLVEHMKISFHSVHQPTCGVCQKHCKSFSSLREHLIGALAKPECSRVFSDKGCDICLKVFDNDTFLSKHKETCCLSAPAPFSLQVETAVPQTESQIEITMSANRNNGERGSEAVALDCEMVGGGFDGSVDICARVCLVDEDERVIFHAYIKPYIPVTTYRSEITGLTEEHFKNAIPLEDVQDKVREILFNGESINKIKLDGGRARLLVGHSIQHDLDCLRIMYPAHMLRDTAQYCPLMKSNPASYSLKYLTKTYLGYEIQSEVHDPYEDSVSVMRLYKRMRDQDHQAKRVKTPKSGTGFDVWKSDELVKMTPDELYDISRSNYKCWCLDSKQREKGSTEQ